jgi:hypothetical protein
MIRKKLLSLLIAAALGTSFILPSNAIAAAPAPTLHNDNPTYNFGDWYTGAVPPNASSTKPVILFVQGLHSNYTTWTGLNSYYEAAYSAGYKTAFVQLQDSDGGGGNMYTNGQVLANVIKKVAAYYGVPKINIIAHSKGGIDTQTALVHYGAYPYVNVVHQLSTPNKGSELADMSYSTWTSWLGTIMGQKDPAVYSLQTSYMANFRSQTDSRYENNYTKTYMSGGMGDDGIFTAYWFAHSVLPGEDDGAVSLYSALGLPYGITSFTKNISHSAMTNASQTWSLVQPKLALGYTSTSALLTKATPLSNASSANISLAGTDKESKASTFTDSNVKENGDLILRGGQVNGSEAVVLPLESSINSVAIEVMTARDSTELALISPSGQTYYSKPAPEDSDPLGIFSKAVRRIFQIQNPEAGNWTLKLNGQDDAYFAMTRIDSVNKLSIKSDKKVLKKGEVSKLIGNFSNNFKGSVKRASMTKSIPEGNAAPASKALADTPIDRSLDLSFTAPSEPGVYNLSFDIEGVNDKGEKVLRSINYNFAVAD